VIGPTGPTGQQGFTGATGGTGQTGSFGWTGQPGPPGSGGRPGWTGPTGEFSATVTSLSGVRKFSVVMLSYCTELQRETVANVEIKIKTRET